jgi:hypothetical protein
LYEPDASTLLRHAEEADIIDGEEMIRFSHEIIQDYYARNAIKAAMAKGQPASLYWPGEHWWSPSAWPDTFLSHKEFGNPEQAAAWISQGNPILAERYVIDYFRFPSESDACATSIDLGLAALQKMEEVAIRSSSASIAEYSQTYLTADGFQYLPALARLVRRYSKQDGAQRLRSFAKSYIASPFRDAVCAIAEMSDPEDAAELFSGIQPYMLQAHARADTWRKYERMYRSRRAILVISNDARVLAEFSNPSLLDGSLRESLLDVCNSGSVGLIHALAFLPEIIVTDEFVPGMSGPTLINYIKRRAETRGAHCCLLYSGKEPSYPLLVQHDFMLIRKPIAKNLLALNRIAAENP